MQKHRMYETLVDLYQKSAKIHYEIDYRDKKSVKKGNRAAEDMKKLRSSFIYTIQACSLNFQHC